MSDAALAAHGAPSPLPPRVVFYDGECGFCDRWVRWLLERDAAARFHFAPLQGETAADARAELVGEFPEGLHTFVFVESVDGGRRVWTRSRGAFRVFQLVGGPWSTVSWLRVLPRWLTDLGYRAFARVRYRVFGRLESCRIPRGDEAARFLP